MPLYKRNLPLQNDRRTCRIKRTLATDELVIWHRTVRPLIEVTSETKIDRIKRTRIREERDKSNSMPPFKVRDGIAIMDLYRSILYCEGQ